MERRVLDDQFDKDGNTDAIIQSDELDAIIDEVLLEVTENPEVPILNCQPLTPLNSDTNESSVVLGGGG